MANEPHKVDKIGYPIDPELRRLQFLLSNLAAEWREAHGQPEKQDDIVRTYHQTLHTLYGLGWDAELDMDAHLPDKLMPEEYVKRNAGHFAYRWTSGQASLSRPFDPDSDT